jgi:hypothetical protein
MIPAELDTPERVRQDFEVRVRRRALSVPTPPGGKPAAGAPRKPPVSHKRASAFPVQPLEGPPR